MTTQQPPAGQQYGQQQPYQQNPYFTAYGQPEPPRKRHALRNVILGAVGILVVMGGCGALLGSDESAPTTATSPVAKPLIVNARAFGDAYEANKVAANQKYAGKRIQLTATVSNINEDRVSIDGITTEPFSLTQISCQLRNKSQAASLMNGQRVTIVGTVDDGQTMGVITFKDCVVS